MWAIKSNDTLLIVLISSLSILGLINFFSASYYYSLIKFGNPYHYFLDNFLFKVTFIGLLFFIIGSFLGKNFFKFKKVFFLIFFVTYFFLILAFLPIFKLEEGSARWIKFGNFSFQPSEIIKPFSLIFLIFILSELKKSFLFSKILFFIFFLIFLLLPIFLQPSLSNVLIIFFSLVAVYFTFMNSGKDFFISLLILFLILLIIVIVSSFWSYRKERFLSFITKGQLFKEKYFQVEQSMIAISSGGFAGKGLGKSEMKIIGLPQMLTDSIFAIYAEEWGFLGSLLYLFLFFLLILRILFLGLKTQQLEKLAFSLGVSSWLLLQTFLHLASNSALLVPTGVVLPFFSQGASGQLAIYFSLGIVNSFKNG
ncbi:MAG: hypothetical protein KatS3mg093_031 [Candidatus Parcubacteria bacterium]|nr:MAG: hypothetical protein KatS3mg093_031 [Candidatus Parcubacteria bacterium]